MVARTEDAQGCSSFRNLRLPTATLESHMQVTLTGRPRQLELPQGMLTKLLAPLWACSPTIEHREAYTSILGSMFPFWIPTAV